LVRQKLYDEGRMVSDISYREFKDFEGGDYPSVIDFARPQEDYSLRVRISKAVMNETLRDEQFVLEQPDGTELVDLTQNPKDKMSQSLVVANLFAALCGRSQRCSPLDGSRADPFGGWSDARHG
jgi:hypothetical protein